MLALESIEDGYLPHGMEQLELYKSDGGSSEMTRNFTDELLERLGTKTEVKQFLLRVEQEEYEEFQRFCKATDSDMTTVLRQMIRLVIEQAKANSEIQKRIKKLKAQDTKKEKVEASKESKPKRKSRKKKQQEDKVEIAEEMVVEMAEKIGMETS